MPLDLRRAEPPVRHLFGWLVGILGVVFTFVALTVGLGAGFVASLDSNVGEDAYGYASDHAWLVSFAEALGSAFSTWPVTGLLTALTVVALVRKAPRIAAWIALSGIVGILGNNLVLKSLFDVARPTWDDPLHTTGGWSFPSGHSATAGVVTTIAVLLAIVLVGRGWRRRVLITVFVVLGVLLAASRIYLGVHRLTDVVAGVAWGSGITLALWSLLVRGTVRLPHELAVLTGTGRKRVAVIVNPIKVGDLDVFKTRVAQVAEAHGWAEPLWFETTVEDPGQGQTAQALRSDVDLIVAAGGDGTVRAVCEEAARTGVAVGILPHGTGNLLARNLGIPLNPYEAIDLVFAGQDRAIDLATFSTDVEGDSAGQGGGETVFLVMAGLGFDAMIMTGVNPDLKAKVGWLAYFVSGIKALRFPPMKVEISVDGGEFKKFRARTVVIGNVGFLQAGIPLLPQAELDDGMLDVVVLAPRTLLGWLGIAIRVIGRGSYTNAKLDRMTGHTVVIRAEKPVPMQLDGDPVGEGTEITASVQHGVLLVRTPHPS